MNKNNCTKHAILMMGRICSVYFGRRHHVSLLGIQSGIEARPFAFETYYVNDAMERIAHAIGCIVASGIVHNARPDFTHGGSWNINSTLPLPRPCHEYPQQSEDQSSMESTTENACPACPSVCSILQGHADHFNPGQPGPIPSCSRSVCGL